MAVACDVCECLELSRQDWEAFLKKNKLYKGMLRFVKLLLFPAAFAQEDVQAAYEGVSDLKTPLMYPVSASEEFNLKEEGFNDVHFEDMIKPGKVEKAADKDWFRCSSYLWKRNFKVKGPKRSGAVLNSIADNVIGTLPAANQRGVNDVFMNLRNVGRDTAKKSTRKTIKTTQFPSLRVT